MGPLDVITIAQAREWLSGVDDPDEVIERIIKSAINWVEQYTDYRLYERQIIIRMYVHGQGIPIFPISIDSVKNKSGVSIDYTTTESTFNTYIWAPAGSVVVATVGYTDIEEIPGPVMEACYNMITYIYENRDMYTVVAPTNIQMQLNQFRRDATV